MKKVQHEEKIKLKDIAKDEKSAIWKKCDMKKVQR